MTGRGAAAVGRPSLQAELVVRHAGFTLDTGLELAAGEVTALLGPNGSGKTTALRALAGLIRLDAGRIGLRWPQPVETSTWADEGIHLPPQDRHVGLVLAEHLLFPHLTLLENVAFGPRSRGVPGAEAQARARHELAEVGMAQLADRRPGQVSSGQAQRAALARALASDPVLLLLDEPLSALDPQTRSATRSTLAHRLADFAGLTLMVTHDPLDALTLADRLVFLQDGRTVQAGTPAEVVTRPRTPYVASVVGLNLLRGTARHGRSLEVEVDGARVITAEEPDAAPAGTQLWVVLNPEAISLFPDRPAGSARNCWPVTVGQVTMTGQRARVGLTGPVPLTAEITAASVAQLRVEPGRRLWAAVKATDLTAYPA